MLALLLIFLLIIVLYLTIKKINFFNWLSQVCLWSIANLGISAFYKTIKNFKIPVLQQKY